MDSTSKLFSRLHLNQKFTDSCAKEMDDMDIDLIYDVPDTTECNSRTYSRRKFHPRHSRGSDRRRLNSSSSSSTAGINHEHAQRHARLVQLINQTLESSDHSPQSRDDVVNPEQIVDSNDVAESTEPIDRSLNIPNNVSHHSRHRGLRRKKGKNPLPVFDGGDITLETIREGEEFSSSGYPPHRTNQQEMRFGHNAYLAPCSPRRSQFSSISGTGSSWSKSSHVDGGAYSFVKTSNHGNMNNIDSYSLSQSESRQGHLKQLQGESLCLDVGMKKLVDNSRTTSYSNAQGKNAAQGLDVGTTKHSEILDGNLTHPCILSPNSVYVRGDKKKGKLVEDNKLSDAQYVKAKLQSDRLFSMKGKEVTSIADDEDDNFLGSSDDATWRKHDLKSKASSLMPGDHVEESAYGCMFDLRHNTEQADLIDLVNDSPGAPIFYRLNPSAVQELPDVENRSLGSQREHKFMKGKRKSNTVSSSHDGRHTSNTDQLETSYVRPSCCIPIGGATRASDNRGFAVDPMLEASAAATDPFTLGISQVESDEMLARQLQEQFYEEVAGSIGTEEIDANIAWSLQQEDARRGVSVFMSDQPDQSREPSMADLYEYYAQLPYRNTNARRSNRSQGRASSRRRNYNGSELDLERTMMAQARNFTEMDLGMRRNFLDALEAAFDDSNDVLAENVLQTHHDFNENDYEMLLALDENNHQQRGASDGQINNLPLSVMQNDNTEEACAVCLENPSCGDVIRHLPCLHKFHKDCIDTWLRRRIWCPVCKSEII